jgi:tetratricopeptide (TPR) repeat protein
MLRACRIALLTLAAVPAGAQMAPPGMMDSLRPPLQSDDDTLILTIPDRDNPTRHVRCGEGSYQQMISDCSEVLSVPNLDYRRRAAAFLTRATARYWLREYPEAIRDYGQALALDARNLNATLGRALAYRESRQYAAAIVDFDAAIRLKSDWADLYLHRAIALAENGDDAKALADLDHVLKLAPNNVIARLNRNIVEYRQEIGPRPAASP